MPAEAPVMRARGRDMPVTVRLGGTKVDYVCFERRAETPLARARSRAMDDDRRDEQRSEQVQHKPFAPAITRAAAQ